MNAAADLLAEARRDGLRVAIAPGGAVKVRGPAPAVERWAPLLRPHKPAIVRLLVDGRELPRPVLDFRLHSHRANAWATALGWPGETVESLAADLRERFGDRLAEVREVGR